MIADPAGNASFTAAFSVDQTPEEVFDAINNVRGWWSENIDGGTEKVGDEFNYRYQEVHRCRIKVTELIPGERVAWRVVDNYFDFTQDKAEWKDTEIHFEITARDGKTEIRFSHVGLAPEYECYDVCANSWGFYLYTSLRALIRTGHGLPNRKEQAASAQSGQSPLQPMEETPMSTTIEGKTILVTGANRGIGQALVTEALRRGAARVYAGTRQPYAHPDPRVTSLALDVTNEGQVGAAAAQVESLDILVNNAGVFLFDDLSDREALERHLAVNLFGTYGMIQAFLPPLIASGGAIVNNVSIAALAPIPVTPAYSLSKAAAFSLTQSLRMLLAGQGVRVHAVLTGPVDTDMVRDLDIPKTSPQSVAQGIFDAVEKGEEDIFPDPQSAALANGWHAGPAKTLERQNAALLQPQPVASQPVPGKETRQ